MSAGAIAIIPARGGSKRVARKNIRPFLGRPMIAYPVTMARESGLFARVVVTTDDPEIAETARGAGAETPFTRPQDLADDHTGTREVMVHAIRALAIAGDVPIACIYPCTPMLTHDDLAAAFALLGTSPERFVFPVVALPIPIERALRRSEDGAVTPVDPDAALARSQDLPAAWRDAGQFYLARASAWLGERAVFDGAVTMVMPPTRAVDIDTEEDWLLAERLASARVEERQR
jgi:pseudaminic acid cytidylyltransferase